MLASVDNQNDVERTRTHKTLVLDVAEHKSKMWMRLARLCDHAFAEIDSHTKRRLQRG